MMRIGSNQLTFSRLVLAFGVSRGGWIALSFLWATVLRFTFEELDILDVFLALSIVFAWPLLEWIFHRFLMHEWTLLPFHRTHHRHHRQPTPETGLPDTWIVAMYFVIASILWWFGLTHLLTLGVTVLAMLVIYEFVHFSCHCNYRPLTAWGWAIRINHLQHHRVDETKQYSMLFPPTAMRKQ